jgi:glycosyltransferase involved in cell wall biosynthesis
VKISFCLTTYNKKELLQIVLEHYFAHKKSNYELIVSDGCSTDGTVEYLKELKEKNLIDTLILSDKRDNGEWEGFKKTLDYITGDYFYLLTDDDFFDFYSINIAIDFLKNNKKVDFLIANGIDFKFNSLEDLNYHSIIKKANSMQSSLNGLHDGVCGLGIFVKSILKNSLELFSPKFGKRTDKAISLTLMNSTFIGASTNIVTYVAIKNEKSNSHMYNYNYAFIEKTETLKLDLNKNFKCDTEFFTKRFLYCNELLNQIRSSRSNASEFQIYL